MSAEVKPFPRAGFVIGDHHCRAPGPEKHLMCFAPYGHEGEHQWDSWHGCLIRVPDYGDIPFHGFAS